VHTFILSCNNEFKEGHGRNANGIPSVVKCVSQMRLIPACGWRLILQTGFKFGR